MAFVEYVPVNPHPAAFRPPLPSSHHAYCGAKAYCMTHLKSLRETRKLPFSIVQVIPGTVLGPSELITTSFEASARMDRMSKALLFGTGPSPRYAFGFAHVEDCAKVHIAALDEKNVPDGEIPDWFIAAASTEKGKNGREIWQEAGDLVEQEFKGEIDSGVFKVGRNNVPINMPFYVDSRMTERMLLGGQVFRSLPECVKEVGHWYKDLAGKT